jgi:hypothetical protein
VTHKSFIRFSIAMALVLPIGALCFLVWIDLHPPDATPVVGPAGASHRAFFVDQSFDEPSFVLYASDWPYRPLGLRSLGEIGGSERYPSPEVRWSSDGSLLIVRAVERGENSLKVISYYDFKNHNAPDLTPSAMDALVNKRGGWGPAFPYIPDGKGG